ncbi:MAG: hypothetical protein Q4D81_13370, partial [Eubacteriales bacterium]|nr:hypothetical protein [Eubacteriales bacterium]
ETPEDGELSAQAGDAGEGDAQAAGSASGENGGDETDVPDSMQDEDSADTPDEDNTQGEDGAVDPDAAAPDDIPEEESGEDFSLSEREINYFYYTKISKEERLLYDAMLALATYAGSGSAGEESRLISLDPSSDEFAQSYTRAYNALVSDHPELFWIAQGRSGYECRYYVLPSFGGQYKVILSLSDPYPAHLEEQERLDAAASSLLDMADLTQSEAGIALQLHDLLIESAWYNTQAGPDDYAHTAYGALVEDSTGNPGGALCDGYALAYEYLLQRAGITCTMICGYAGASDEDIEKHAWNLILLDDEWYEVDATWDDLDFTLSPSEEGYELFLEALSDEDYMSRIRHYMWGRTTEQMRSFTPGEEYTYVSYNGWVTLLQPSVHIRFTEEESEETRDYVTPLAPAAEGDWYSWEMLTGHE